MCVRARLCLYLFLLCLTVCCAVCLQIASDVPEIRAHFSTVMKRARPSVTICQLTSLTFRHINVNGYNEFVYLKNIAHAHSQQPLSVFCARVHCNLQVQTPNIQAHTKPYHSRSSYSTKRFAHTACLQN